MCLICVVKLNHVQVTPGRPSGGPSSAMRGVADVKRFFRRRFLLWRLRLLLRVGTCCADCIGKARHYLRCQDQECGDDNSDVNRRAAPRRAETHAYVYA